MDIPAPIMQCIGDHALEPVSVGCSGASVYRVAASPGMYLKIAATPKDMDEMEYEIRLLAWLDGKLKVPGVISSLVKGGKGFLLMSEVPGVPSSMYLHEDKERCIIKLAQGLRSIHSLDINGCPFDQGLDTKLVHASRHVDMGVVDEGDFGDDAQGLTSREVLDKLLASRPGVEDPVFTHGDYCLPNVMIEGGEVSGFVDLGRGGVGDRYHDLALALRSLRHNLEYYGEHWLPEYAGMFLEAYGMRPERFDEGKAAYYRLLDELF